MNGPYFSLNGTLLPIERGSIPIDDVNFAYGFGVYETLKVRGGMIFFPELHEERLFHSAKVIGLGHVIAPGGFVRWLKDLVRANAVRDANLKALLIGGTAASDARLFLMALNPLFPDRKLYKNGASAITWEGERAYPSAKTLNMLVPTLAYREAQAARAYDALLVNRRGEITEGTRTNFFYTDGRTVFTPPAADVLEGITKLTVCRMIRSLGLPLEERPLPRAEIGRWQGFFLTSTSTKIMPLNRIDGLEVPLSPFVSELMDHYSRFLSDYIKG